MTRFRHVALVMVLAALALPTPARGLPSNTRVQVYTTGLEFPVDAIHLPGTTRILVTERITGRIEEIRNGALRPGFCADLDVATNGERGLLGITIHPNFSSNGFVYVFYTANTKPKKNRVDRFTYDDGRCRDRTRIVGGIHSGFTHNGGQIDFMDGKLFVSVGEGGDPEKAQDLDRMLGKILRFNPDGSIPKTNPFNLGDQRSPVWSLGHRNGFGLAVRRDTSQLYETENGPTCDDELNLIERGNNYGWGEGYVCSGSGYDPVGDPHYEPVDPIFRFKNGTDVVAPTDAWWYEGRMDALDDQLFATSYIHGRLHRFDLSNDGTNVSSEGTVYDDPGKLIDVFKGPGGWLYFISIDSELMGTVKRIVPD